MHEGIRSDTLLFCQGKEKKHTNRQTKKKQTGHKKAQTATLEGAGEARDGGRGGGRGEGGGVYSVRARSEGGVMGGGWGGDDARLNKLQSKGNVFKCG